jgi:hypothetical protein
MKKWEAENGGGGGQKQGEESMLVKQGKTELFEYLICYDNIQ